MATNPFFTSFQLNLKGVTPALIVTDSIRDAWSRWTGAVDQLDRAERAVEEAKARNANAERKYAQAIADAVHEGVDVTKVSPPKLTDTAPLEATVKATREALSEPARAAATDLRAALVAAAPDQVRVQRERLDVKREVVNRAIDELKSALIDYNAEERLLGFWETQQLHPEYVLVSSLTGEVPAELARALDGLARSIGHEATARRQQQHDVRVSEVQLTRDLRVESQRQAEAEARLSRA